MFDFRQVTCPDASPKDIEDVLLALPNIQGFVDPDLDACDLADLTKMASKAGTCSSVLLALPGALEPRSPPPEPRPVEVTLPAEAEPAQAVMAIPSLLPMGDLISLESCDEEEEGGGAEQEAHKPLTSLLGPASAPGPQTPFLERPASGTQQQAPGFSFALWSGSFGSGQTQAADVAVPPAHDPRSPKSPFSLDFGSEIDTSLEGSVPAGEEEAAGATTGRLTADTCTPSTMTSSGGTGTGLRRAPSAGSMVLGSGGAGRSLSLRRTRKRRVVRKGRQAGVGSLHPRASSSRLFPLHWPGQSARQWW